MSETKVPTAPCPNCKKPVRFAQDNPFRPFCCHHCKLIDLGSWADGSYRIPTQDGPGSDEAHMTDDKES